MKLRRLFVFSMALLLPLLLGADGDCDSFFEEPCTDCGPPPEGGFWCVADCEAGECSACPLGTVCGPRGDDGCY